jgi:hypothetical protein
MIETQVEGTTIPKAVSVEGVVPEAEVLEGADSGPEMTIASEATEEVRDDALPESSMDVVVQSPEIQDAEPIRSAPMLETAVTSRGGLKLLADDLIDPAMVARNLESMRRVGQWMKVRDSTLELSNSTRTEYPSNGCCLVQDVVERSQQKSDMLQGYGDTVLRAEMLEKELKKARKHSAMLQSKLDGAFAQYHNEVQEMHAKRDDLIRKKKSLCQKNKGTPPPALSSTY